MLESLRDINYIINAVGYLHFELCSLLFELQKYSQHLIKS